MTVCVCISSRGRPLELEKTVEETLARATCGGSVVAAIDDDDAADYGFLGTRARRENSLGAKYNRAASYAPPDTSLFVLGVDDCYLSTRGWDERLLQAASKFEDGVGVVYFGGKSKDFGQLPDGMAVTKGWIDQVGFFMPPYFPFWWHDTWVDELARMTGRYVWADVSWEKFGKTEQAGTHKTTRMREVSWWARFFDSTRQMRVNKSVEMINRLDYPEWLRTQLKQEMQATANMLWRRNALVRDYGKQFEGTYGGGAAPAPDLGYVQIRAEAETLLGQVSKRTAHAAS